MGRFLAYLQAASIFIYFVFKAVFGFNKTSIKSICAFNLVKKPEGSYRLNNNEHTDVLVILKYAYRQLLKWKNAKTSIPLNCINNIALFDGAIEETERLNYIESVTGERPGLFIVKESLSNYKTSKLNVFFKVIGLVLIIVLLFPFSFTKLRAQVALVIFEIDECATLLYILKKNKINKLYYSCIFEKDSNACTYVLLKNNIEVIKNPSEDPLYFNNQQILATSLGICNPYQIEEVKVYAKTMHFKNTLNWYPENHLVQLHNKPFYTSKQNVIGYYSGSSWLRIALNYNLVSAAFNPYKAEEECETYIKTFIENNSEYTLKVFLHPLEKKHIELTKKHFEKVWPTISYTFMDLNMHTTETFHECDLAISVFSGVMYYRFYAGFKGLLYCPYMANFPLPNSVLEAVSAKTENELIVKAKHFLTLTNTEFKQDILLNQYNYTYK